MIEDRVGQELLSIFGQSIAQGKRYRDIIIREYPAFCSYTGKYLQPHILHACTDFAITQYMPKTSNVKITEACNTRNYSFLQIEAEHFYLTTSYVEQCLRVPRNAHFRRDRAISNPYLFNEFEEQRYKGKPYLILVHGFIEEKKDDEIFYQNLFGGIGMPCGDMPTRWNDFYFLTDYIDLATDIPEEIIDELAPGFLKIKKNFIGNVDNNDSA